MLWCHRFSLLELPAAAIASAADTEHAELGRVAWFLERHLELGHQKLVLAPPQDAGVTHIQCADAVVVVPPVTALVQARDSLT
jgi:hypothetical protein